MSDFLPPVLLRLGADISEYVAKLAVADAELQAFIHNAQSHLADSAPFTAAGRAAGKAYADALPEAARVGADKVTRDVTGRLRDARGRFVAEGEHAGDAVGGAMHRGILSHLDRLVTDIGSAGSKIGSVFSGIGSVAGGAWKAALPTAITAGVGGAAQMISALAPAVGALALLPAAALAGATALGTLKVALSGVGNALSAGMSGDAQKFAEALKGLAPAAQQTVRAIVGLKPQLDAIKQTVQQNFFTGLASDIKILGSQYLPVLRTELGYTATGFNEVIGSIAGMAKTPGFLDSVRESLHNVMRAVTNVLGVLPGFVSGFNDLINVGSRFLPGLTAGFTAAGDRFSEFMARVAGSGQLAAFIQNGIDALRLLGPLLRDVTSILSSLFQAMGASGGQALGVLGQLVGTIAEFLKSAGGMQVLTTLFQILGQVANTVGTGLGQVLVALGPLLGALLTGLQPIIGLLTGQFLPVVVQLVSVLASALIPVIDALAPALMSVLTALMPVVTLLGDALGQTLPALAPVLAVLATVLGEVLVSALNAVMPLFTSLMPVIAQLAVAVLPALIPIIRILADLLIAQAPLIAIVATLLAAVLAPAIKLLIPVVEALVPPLTWVADKLDKAVAFMTSFTAAFDKGLTSVSTWRAVGKWFTDIWHDITGFFAGVGSAIANFFTVTIPGYFDRAVAWFQALPGRVLAALQRLPGILASAAKTAFDRFFYILGYGIGFAVRMLFELPPKIWGIVTDLWDTTVRIVSRGVDDTVSYIRALPLRAAIFFGQLWHDSVQFITNLIVDVGIWMSQLPGKVAKFAADTWDQTNRLFSSGVDAVVGFAQSLPGRAADAVSGLWSSISHAIGDLWDKGTELGRNLLEGLISGIRNTVQKAVNAVVDAIGNVIQGAWDALQPGSPSRVFARMGKNAVDGFVQGIDVNAPNAVEAVTKMLSFGRPQPFGSMAFAGAGGGGFRVPASSAVGAGTPAAPIVVQANLYIDGKQVHQALIPHAQKYRIRTGSTGLETPPR